MDSSWKLAADLGSTVKARGEEGEGLGDGVVKRPLRGAIGVLLAQAKAKVRFAARFASYLTDSFLVIIRRVFHLTHTASLYFSFSYVCFIIHLPSIPISTQ